jgi:hypothetical protein
LSGRCLCHTLRARMPKRRRVASPGGFRVSPLFPGTCNRSR